MAQAIAALINPLEDKETEITEEETNFLRLMLLLLKIAPRAVRQTFDTFIPRTSLRKKLDDHQGDLQKLRDRHIVSKEEWQLLFPTQGRSTSSSKFDLTLMTLILREVSKVSPPSTGWKQLPPNTDTTPGADLIRIKFYRNKIAHASNCSMNNHDFNNIWNDLKHAVIRLGGKSMESEVDALRTTKLDRAEQDMYRELGKLKKEIIPYNIKYLQQERIRNWKIEGKMYVETRASDCVQNAVKSSPLIAVIGPSGSGKSIASHTVALDFQSHGFSLIPVTSVKCIIEYWLPGEKQMFVYDDPFGTGDVDEVEINAWYRILEDLQKCSNIGNLKIIVTIRKHIMLDKRVSNLLANFKYETVDISSPQLKLSDTEKKNIFETHARFNNKPVSCNEHVTSCPLFSFPLLCRHFASSKESEINLETFFNKPKDVLTSEITNIRENAKEQYFALVLCMLYDNNLNENVLDPSDASKENKVIRKIFLELCGLPTSTSRVVIKSKLDCLLGSYLRKESKMYKFVHDIIHDTFVSTLPSEFHSSVLKYASSHFILNRVRLFSVTSEDEEQEFQPFIILDHELQINWGERMVNDIVNGDICNVFFNPCLNYDRADEILVESFKSQSIDLVKLICQPCKSDDVATIGKTDNSLLDLETVLMIYLSDERCTPLHWIVARNIERTFMFLWNHIETSMQTIFISDVLFFLLAVFSRNANIVKLLLESGVKVNKCYKRDRYGSSPLGIASYKGYSEIIQILIENGAEMEIESISGWTPLMQGIGGRHGEVVQFLIDKGADIHKQNNQGDTPLHVACRRGKPGIVRMLLKKGAEVNICNKYEETPLASSLLRGHTNVAEMLIQNGANINYFDMNGNTVLHKSAGKGEDRVVKFLIENGSDLNYLNKHSKTPLYKASEKGHLSTVKLLAENGASVNLGESERGTPLCTSSFHGHEGIVEYLLSNGAEVNKGTNLPPIFCASYNANINVMNLLLDKGADINTCDDMGITAIQITATEGHENAVQLLLNRGAVIDAGVDATPLKNLSEFGDPKIVKLLVDNGADVRRCNNNGVSPLFAASFHGRKDIVEILIEKSVEIDACNEYNCTPLFAASCFGHDQIVQLLIQKGADVNKCDKDNKSPIFMAALLGYLKVVQVLIDNGADVSHCDNEGKSPLQMALKEKHKEIVQILKKSNVKVSNIPS